MEILRGVPIHSLTIKDITIQCNKIEVGPWQTKRRMFILFTCCFVRCRSSKTLVLSTSSKEKSISSWVLEYRVERGVGKSSCITSSPSMTERMALFFGLDSRNSLLWSASKNAWQSLSDGLISGRPGPWFWELEHGSCLWEKLMLQISSYGPLWQSSYLSEPKHRASLCKPARF